MKGEARTRVDGESGGLPGPVQRFLSLFVGLTLLCVASELVCWRVLHLDYPFTWPLMDRADSFYDFTLYLPRFAYFHSPNFFTFDGPGYVYPAPLAALHGLLSLLPAPTKVFLGLLVVAWLMAAVLWGRLLLRRGLTWRAMLVLVGIVAALSYPFWFEFEQANLEWILCVLVGAGVVAFLNGRGYTAGVCLGVAGSMKIYPLVFLGLLLARKQYKQMAVALIACGLSLLAGLWLVCPDLAVSWHGMLLGMEQFRQWYVLSYMDVGFDHSLIAVCKAISLIVLPDELPMSALSLLVWIYISAAAFAGILTYFDVIRKRPVINQVMCLTVATILLPPVSFDYTLLHLYVPWALLVLLALENRGRDVPGLTAAMVCCAILFAPETELIVHGQTYGGQVKACALVGLLLIALVRKFPSAYDLEAPTLGAR